MKYIIGIDQSTQGTKAVLFDETGRLVRREDYQHEQIINDRGWVSHDLEKIYENLLLAVKAVVENAGIEKDDIAAVGISNQRETTAAWEESGKPIAHAIVWQCSRAENIVERYRDRSDEVYEKTGIPLSPYFPAGKMAWLMEHSIQHKNYHLGTVDSWLVYKLTGGKSFKTDYSNASRTQLFNLHTLQWDAGLCEMFGIPMEALPEVCDSNACFGYTDFDGFLNHDVPIHGVMGDSHAALYGQGCHGPGMVKTTYGTGSSVMMNIGETFLQSRTGLATSLAWCMDGRIQYVLEGNINYTGAVISWLQNDMHLITNPAEVEAAAFRANPEDTSVLVPAFTGLSAPYWKGSAKAMLCGMTRTTGQDEVIKASLESIAFQIADVLKAMKEDSKTRITELRVDGGPTKNRYLMQFQSDLAKTAVCVAGNEELSAIGAAYMAGIAAGICDEKKVFANMTYRKYQTEMPDAIRKKKMENWKSAVEMVLHS